MGEFDNRPPSGHRGRVKKFLRARSSLGVAVLLFLGILSSGCASPARRPPVAAEPSARGHLLIVGGGPVPDSLIARFLELAGGAGRARIAVLPMASEDPDAGIALTEELRKLGAAAERVVLDRAAADTEAGAARLSGATGIWFGGGDQAKLTAAIGGTRAEAEIHARYRAGAVLGGTSAGAAVMSTPMITGDERKPGGNRPPAKESSDAFMTIARDNVVTTRGFSLIGGTIIDQHFVRRRRNNRLVSVVLEHPDLVGIGIDESTALEVGPEGPWRVLGESVAVVYDARDATITPPGARALGATGIRMLVLPAGSRYNRATGKAELPGPSK